MYKCKLYKSIRQPACGIFNQVIIYIYELFYDLILSVYLDSDTGSLGLAATFVASLGQSSSRINLC